MIVPGRGGLKYGTALQAPPTQPGAAGSMAQNAAMQSAMSAPEFGSPTPSVGQMGAALGGLPGNMLGITNFTGDFRDPSSIRYNAPQQTTNDISNTGLTMAPSSIGGQLGTLGGQLGNGLGGMNRGLGGQSGPTGGQIGMPMTPSFSKSGKSIPELAARTVGETVNQAIRSRLPQMSQGIGSLVERSLLSSNGGGSFMF